MKKKLLSGTLKKGLTFVFLLALIAGFALAQSGENSAKVLQRCIDLPDLQKYFQNANGALSQQMYIMRHGVSFEDDILIMKFGNPVIFLDKLEMSVNNINEYFLFYIFEITDNKARADFTYKRKKASPANMRVYLELKKDGDNWEILKKIMEEK